MRSSYKKKAAEALEIAVASMVNFRYELLYNVVSDCRDPTFFGLPRRIGACKCGIVVIVDQGPWASINAMLITYAWPLTPLVWPFTPLVPLTTFFVPF